jgi:hypothetical protein
VSPLEPLGRTAVNIVAGMAVVCATGRGADGIDAALGGAPELGGGQCDPGRGRWVGPARGDDCLVGKPLRRRGSQLPAPSTFV